uniref:hypothetical protein n=1 Tax=Salmonella sp. s29873 TaxID=3159634 RepID=UPI00397FC9EC
RPYTHLPVRTAPLRQLTNACPAKRGPVLLLMLAALAVGETAAKGVQRVASVECSNDYGDGDSLYNYTAEDIWGERNISLSKFRGKVVLVVNVATY